MAFTSSSVLSLSILAVLVAGALCSTPGRVVFSLEKGSTPTKLTVDAKHYGGDEFSQMQIKGQGSDKWIDMANATGSKSGGSIWKAESATPLKAPLVIRFKTTKGTKFVDVEAINSF